MLAVSRTSTPPEPEEHVLKANAFAVYLGRPRITICCPIIPCVTKYAIRFWVPEQLLYLIDRATSISIQSKMQLFVRGEKQCSTISYSLYRSCNLICNTRPIKDFWCCAASHFHHSQTFDLPLTMCNPFFKPYHQHSSLPGSGPGLQCHPSP